MLPDLNLSLDENDVILSPNDEELGESSTNVDELDPAPENISNTANTGRIRIGPNLTNIERNAVYNILTKNNISGRPKKGMVAEIADLFGVHYRTINHIWRQGKLTGDIRNRMTGKIGRKMTVVDLSSIPQIPLQHRTTLRSLGGAMGVPPTILFRAMKSGAIRRNTNHVKPFLTDTNKRARLEFCLSMLDQSTIEHEPTFKDMYNIVHIDEKWFYMSKKSQRYYLSSEEEDPLRTCKSKNFIAKVMFLVVTGRPRFDLFRNITFSGKIGVFSFVVQVTAIRNSANRSAGTLETKPITSVTRDIMRSFMIDKVLPAIKEKWPREDSSHHIFIQQDNARTHIDVNDPEFCEAAQEDGFDIRLMCQPPNSQDLNILDLGFFAAIQSMQQKFASRTIDELVTPVVASFEAYPTALANRFFISLQTCMVEIMKIQGCNNNKIPHIKKAILERENSLPTTITCDQSLVRQTVEYLAGVI